MKLIVELIIAVALVMGFIAIIIILVFAIISIIKKMIKYYFDFSSDNFISNEKIEIGSNLL